MTMQKSNIAGAGIRPGNLVPKLSLGTRFPARLGSWVIGLLLCWMQMVPAQEPGGFQSLPGANKTTPFVNDIPDDSFDGPAANPQEKAPPIVDKPAAGPMPRVLDGMPTNATRLPRLASPFVTPQPTKKDLDDAKRFISDIVSAGLTLDVVAGRGSLITLKEVAKRVQIVDDHIAQVNVLDPKCITVVGRHVGTTNLNIWFADPLAPNKERILSYLVRVFPDPEAKERMERVYLALQNEINKAFPDSIVHIKLVGDKVVLSGQARDIMEATNIIRIVRAHTPDDDARIPTPYLTTTPAGVPGTDQFRITTIEQYRNITLGTNIVNLLRVPGEQQVMLRVIVAEVNRTAARSIGLNFALTNSSGNQVVANRTGLIETGGTNFASFGGLGGLSSLTGLGGTLAGLATNNIPAALDNGQIRLAINALRNLNYARSIAEPTLTTMNGQTASFHSGGQFPIPEVSGYTASGLQGVTFVQFGVHVTFTPYITDKDKIRLNIQARVSTRDNSALATIGGTVVPSMTGREFATTVELRDGQTMAVAGLIQNNLGTESTRIPGIGDLPGLAWLTGFQRTSAAEQELVVLITPELVHPMEAKEVPPLPGSDLFEPGDLEFYVLGRLESRRHYDFRSPVMTDWARMRSYHRCERIYMFGPHGYAAPDHVQE